MIRPLCIAFSVVMGLNRPGAASDMAYCVSRAEGALYWIIIAFYGRRNVYEKQKNFGLVIIGCYLIFVFEL
jgi:hypothetical protein